MFARMTALRISVAFFAAILLRPGPQVVWGQDEQPGGAKEKEPIRIDDVSSETVDELIDIIERLTTKNRELELRIASLELELKTVRRQKEELEDFIEQHDEYGDAFEEYQIFRQKAEQEMRAERAAQRQAELEERRRKAREARLARRAEAEGGDDDAPYADRFEKLRKAGFTRIGDTVFVGEMGTTYRTETEREIRYSPVLGIYYTDEDEVVDWSELTLSGSVIHAHDQAANVVFAIAFYSDSGSQIGQTTIRVDGAQPGVPYPFTSKVTMASEKPFKSYNGWVLNFDPIPPPPPPPNDGGAP